MTDGVRAVLDRFVALEGVCLAMVVGTDGLVVESVRDEGADACDVEAVGAVATAGLEAGRALAREVTRGDLTQTLVEFERGLLVIEPIGKLGILVVLSQSASTIGRVRLVLRRERPALEEALAS
ncbi:MAG: roadblock/LC7 domain-containing protein [Chloroflexota bacterium]